MPILKYVRLIEQIDQLIKLKATGTPLEFAQKLNISRRQLFNYLNELREMDVPISYDTKRESYIYTSEGNVQIKFMQKM